MQPKFRRLVIGATALAVAAGGLVVSSNPAQALPAGTPSDGSVNIPASQALTAPLAMSPNPAPAICDGITSVDQTKWHAFISDAANDPATIDYTGSGATAPVGFTSSLLSTAGTFITNQNTSSIGQITPIPGFNLSLFGAALVPGEYNIGFACSLAGETTNFWSTPVTITATTISQGARPAAPTLDTLTPGNGTLTAAFTAPTGSDPAIDDFTVTATPQGGGTAVTATGTASPITVTGLTNGTVYDVVVTAANTVGTSDDSNALSATPAVQGQPPVQALSAIPGAQACTVSWQAPASGPAPTNYTVTVTPAISGSPFTVTSPLSLELTGLAAGTSYGIEVIANYPSPDFGTAANTSCVPTSAQFIVQEVSVVRPPGALVLTQRCGVYGELAAFTGTNDFPGFVTDVTEGGIALPLEAANGVFPGGNPTLGPDGTGGTDPEFGEYPNPDPASYPTYCDLELGTAQLVTAGNIAGYYQAEGRLNQVSVLDTRDGDPGWTLNGEMADFDDGFGVGFEGSYLGWKPVVTDVTTTAGYTQVVTEGPQVLPGTGVTDQDPLLSANSGLGNGEVLASANAGEGLGVAILDARILLLIPPSVPAGTYEGDLTLSFL